MRATPKIKTLLRRNRQPADRSAETSFSLRKLFLFGFGMAVLCGLRWFGLALCIFVYAVNYYACLEVGWALTRKARPAALPRVDMRNRWMLPALISVILCSISNYFVWHTIAIVCSHSADDLRQFLYSPALGVFSLGTIQHLALAALHLALLLSYGCNCWNAPRIDLSEFRTTVAFSSLLTFTYLAQPWFIEQLGASYFHFMQVQLVPESHY